MQVLIQVEAAQITFLVMVIQEKLEKVIQKKTYVTKNHSYCTNSKHHNTCNVSIMQETCTA